MTTWNYHTDDDAAALRADFASANIKLVKAISPAWHKLDERGTAVDLKQVESYRLLVNDRDTGLFVHRSLKTDGSQWDRRYWNVSAANGKMVSIPGMYNLSTRREAVAVAYATDRELIKTGNWDREPVAMNNTSGVRTGRLWETWRIIDTMPEVNNA